MTHTDDMCLAIICRVCVCCMFSAWRQDCHKRIMHLGRLTECAPRCYARACGIRFILPYKHIVTRCCQLRQKPVRQEFEIWHSKAARGWSCC